MTQHFHPYQTLSFLFPQVKNLISVDKKVQQCGKDLAVFKEEYIKAKTAYQAVLQKAADEEKRLNDLLDRRDFRYS